MYGSQYQMPGGVNKLAFPDSIVAPKDENQVFFLSGKGVNNGIGKLLPAFSLVRAGLACSHRERGIKQQDTLPGPVLQITAGGNRCAGIVFNFGENIAQAGWKLNPVVHREAKAMGLSRSVIGILPQNNHFGLGERTLVKCIEDQSGRRVNGLCSVLGADKFS